LLRRSGASATDPHTGAGARGHQAERGIGSGSDAHETERGIGDRYPTDTVEGELRPAVPRWVEARDCERDHGAKAVPETIEERKPGTSRGDRQAMGPSLRE
jgi:hypothetical protein